jgi:hypothetical protein
MNINKLLAGIPFGALRFAQGRTHSASDVVSIMESIYCSIDESAPPLSPTEMNRLTLEFCNRFCDCMGAIQWPLVFSAWHDVN